MSNFSSAEEILAENNPYRDNYRLTKAMEAQAHATLALVEAQETANLLAFLEWVDYPSQFVSHGEYVDVIKQVKGRIKPDPK